MVSLSLFQCRQVCGVIILFKSHLAYGFSYSSITQPMGSLSLFKCYPASRSIIFILLSPSMWVHHLSRFHSTFYESIHRLIWVLLNLPLSHHLIQFLHSLPVSLSLSLCRCVFGLPIIKVLLSLVSSLSLLRCVSAFLQSRFVRPSLVLLQFSSTILLSLCLPTS